MRRTNCRFLPRRLRRALALTSPELLLSVLLVARAGPVLALDLAEGFERDWGRADAPTCRAGHQTFVRRVASRACASGPSSWGGALRAEHGAPACPEDAECGGSWLAVERFDDHVATGDPIGLANGGVLEILTTRRPQSSVEGRLRVDLQIHEDVPVTGAGEHYLVMHNLVLSEGDCARDCEGIAHTATNRGDGPDRYRWYGVIGGAFGEPQQPDSPIRLGSVGFAVEVPRAVRGPGDRPNDLIDASFLPYSVGGEGKAFPAGWYRISIERDSALYRYAVRRWDGHRFVPIVPDDAARGGTHERSFPARLLAEPLGSPLPPGYVGLSVAWFGGAERVGAHVDWDDLEVHW